MTDKYILWDFDGTLASRDGMWGGTLLEILETEEPGLCATRDDLRPHLQSGFPWHTPETPHSHISDAEAWWTMLLPVFEHALSSLGLSAVRAADLAARVPAQFCCRDKWKLCDYPFPALNFLSERGWSHVSLSNHVPELPSIVSGLGLAAFFEEVHTSAVTGYEKPHPDAFRVALRSLPDSSRVWMVGDNPIADVKGAEQVGIQAILVRRTDERAKRQCDGLVEAAEIMESTQPDGCTVPTGARGRAPAVP
jgi:putative hydrolase of the HAD superfamily